ncbi:hypothetical protein HDU76_009914, partial [Blyttiomyces sp. JEL0837]
MIICRHDECDHLVTKRDHVNNVNDNEPASGDYSAPNNMNRRRPEWGYIVQPEADMMRMIVKRSSNSQSDLDSSSQSNDHNNAFAESNVNEDDTRANIEQYVPPRFIRREQDRVQDQADSLQRKDDIISTSPSVNLANDNSETLQGKDNIGSLVPFVLAAVFCAIVLVVVGLVIYRRRISTDSSNPSAVGGINNNNRARVSIKSEDLRKAASTKGPLTRTLSNTTSSTRPSAQVQNIALPSKAVINPSQQWNSYKPSTASGDPRTARRTSNFSSSIAAAGANTIAVPASFASLGSTGQPVSSGKLPSVPSAPSSKSMYNQQNQNKDLIEEPEKDYDDDIDDDENETRADKLADLGDGNTVRDRDQNKKSQRNSVASKPGEPKTNVDKERSSTTTKITRQESSFDDDSEGVSSGNLRELNR